MDLSELINLPDTKIINATKEKYNELHIVIETTELSTACRICGKELKKRHGCDKERKVRHLPVFGRPTYIIYKPHRYICEDCDDQPTTTATPSWYKQNSSYTVDYETHILMELVNSTLVDVSVKEQLTESSVKGILDRHIASELNWAVVSYIGVIGIDEIALKKGHKNYVTLITSRNEGIICLLAVMPGREKAKITAFLKSMPKKLKKTVEAICTDMYDGYVNAAREVFRNKAIVVIDRFHVAKLYRKSLDKFRQKVLPELKQTLTEKEYEKLKGAMHILRKGNECNRKKEKDIINELFSHSEELMEAYSLGVKLTQIFNTHMSKGDSLKKLNEWRREVRRSKLTCFDSFIKTLRKYKNEIANYFLDRNTSAFVEGVNNKAKVLKRRCYGIFNVKHLFQRLHLDLSGYRLFGLISVS